MWLHFVGSLYHFTFQVSVSFFTIFDHSEKSISPLYHIKDNFCK